MNQHRNFTILLICITCLVCYAQVPEEKIKSLYLYNFAKNIDWGGSQEITIAVYNADKVYQEMVNNIQGRSVGSAIIKVKKITSLAEGAGNKMIYLGEGSTADLQKAIELAKSSQAVLITEDDLANKGAGISFFRDGSKLKFKINSSYLSDVGLTATKNLLSLAVVI